MRRDYVLSHWLLPLLIVAMMAGALWSRGLLSTSLIIFIAISIIFYGREGWQELKKSPWLWGMILLFIIPAITRFWSEDHYQWSRIMQTKIPLLLLPLCTAAIMKISGNTQRWLVAALVVFSLIASIFSYWSFFTANDTVENYLKAKVISVPMGDDHVRFSWLLLVVYIFLIDEWKKQTSWWIIALIVYFAIYFHVLAAKTGLLGFYLVSFISLLKYGKKKFLLPAGLALLCIPLLAWALVPSFRNRLKFVVWDYQNYSRGNYTEGLSDAPRILSFRAGAEIIQQHPITGTGAGDVLHDTEEWYAVHANFLKSYERVLPSNQVLVYACAAGILGGLAAMCIFLYPFFMQKHRHYFAWISFHAVAFMGFIYEIGLEVQYGVFIFGFLGAWLYCRVDMGLHPAGPLKRIL